MHVARADGVGSSASGGAGQKTLSLWKVNPQDFLLDGACRCEGVAA